MTNNIRTQRGFTIIELTLAMAFIGIMMLLIVTSIVHMTRIYSKGLAIKQINQAGRQITETIGADLRYSGGDPNNLPQVVDVNDRKGLCTSSYTYAWNVIDNTTPLGPSRNMVRFPDAAKAYCDPSQSFAIPNSAVEILGPQVSIASFDIDAQLVSDIEFVLSTNGNNSPTKDGASDEWTCLTNEFCSFVEFHTAVYARKGM